MVSPIEASLPAGTLRLNEVRYQEVPATAAGSGTGLVDQPEPGKRGRGPPGRSPERPPLLSGPRVVSTIAWPPASPWIFHVVGSVTEVEISPRPSFCASLTPPSWLCPSLRTITESTWLPPTRSAEGTAKEAVPVVVGA